MEKDAAILMADLTGYTAMTDIHGGASAAKIVNKYMELVDESLHGTTQVVQRIGDQVVMLSDEPLDTLVTARQLNASTLEEHHFLTIHAGIHYGSILLENGNLFGSTINVAARIMNIASRGQILCSSAFVNEVKNQSGITFKPFGKHKLKNVMVEIELFELSSADQSTPFHVDPVCHMQVDPQKGNHTFNFQGKTFHFCGIRCMDLFKSNPEAFTAP